MPNALYYGDNLDVLRESIASESVDLVYLDPPFNSQATYNLLFRSPTGSGSQAQIEAFEDTWHWGQEAESAFDQVMRSGNTDTADVLRAMRSFLGENDMQAYLAMMAIRLIELHRVLKKAGSLYLHCDPTASHYLKILLDAVFGAGCYRNEIVWKRTSTHSDSKTWSKVADTILFYTRGRTRPALHLAHATRDPLGRLPGNEISLQRTGRTRLPSPRHDQSLPKAKHDLRVAGLSFSAKGLAVFEGNYGETRSRRDDRLPVAQRRKPRFHKAPSNKALS